MNTLEFTPTCKYGHGDLKIEPKGSFAYVKVEEMERSGIAGIGKHFVYRLADNTFFRIQLWRCPTCGYIETFDAD
jgi:hypothetical protein